MRHRPYPYAIVPKTPLRVGCGCILYCMETRCIGCMLQLYMHLASSRLARHAIQPIQPIQLYSYTRYTAYSTIQPPSDQSNSDAAAGFEVDSSAPSRESRPGVDARPDAERPRLGRVVHGVGAGGGTRADFTPPATLLYALRAGCTNTLHIGRIVVRCLCSRPQNTSQAGRHVFHAAPTAPHIQSQNIW